jgi:CRP/FNR family cyclic AMP-dependent transcriptional regulator
MLHPLKHKTTGTMLEKIPLFEDVPNDALSALNDVAVRRKLRRNTIVISEGDETDSLYIIETGRVRVFSNNDEGREFILATMGPGEYFGELALIDDGPRSASVMTVEASTFWTISKEDLTAWLMKRPENAMALLKAMALRLRGITEDLTSLALQDVYGRVVRLLMRDARDEDGIQVTGPMTQQDIADRVGASREMVSRVLQELKRGEYISSMGKRIRIDKAFPRHW